MQRKEKGKTWNKNIEKVQETHIRKTYIHAHTHKTHENTKTIIDKQKRVKVKKIQHWVHFVLAMDCLACVWGGVPLSVACVPFPFVRGCLVDSPWFRDGSSCPLPLSGMGLHVAWPSAAPAHAAVVSWVHLYTSPSVWKTLLPSCPHRLFQLLCLLFHRAPWDLRGGL